LQRVAQRTIEQQRIMANNVSIRRACESLKNSSYQTICLALAAEAHRIEWPITSDGESPGVQIR